jgi:hypothetical protein
MIEIKLSILGNRTRAETDSVKDPVTKLGYVATEMNGAKALDALVVALSKHYAGEKWAVTDPPGLKGTVPNGARKRAPSRPKSRRLF